MISTTLTPARRAGVLLATTVLVPSGLLAGPATGAPPAAAATRTATGPDHRPVAQGAGWLVRQLTDGLMHNQQYGFDDYGLSIDTAFALHAVGRRTRAVNRITDAVAAHIDSYTTGADFGSPDDIYAGSVAKALALVAQQGRDPQHVGSVDLQQRLEDRVATTAPLTGRIQDAGARDYANVIGQAYAAQALTQVSSDKADSATAFLRQQQCTGRGEGFFRLQFSDPAAAVQSCDGAVDPSPDTDVTSIAVDALLATGADADDPTVSAAGDWLLDQQHRNGSFGGGPSTSAPNTNSTGLAGDALRRLGHRRAARRAAVFVRRHEVHEVHGCHTALRGQRGAVAYDDAGYAAGAHDGITDNSADQWRRATAQALPVLLAARSAGGPVSLSSPRGYHRAGSRARFVATWVAPGDSVCVHRRGHRRVHRATTANRWGVARLRLRLPGHTGRPYYLARDSADRTAATSVRVLGRTTLAVHLRSAAVARGTLQHLRVSGLARREHLTVVYRDRQLRRTRADRDGRYRTTFHVGRRPGEVTVRVRGQFPRLRHGRATFRVR